MLVHTYDATTGDYVGPYTAQENPLEPGKYITPTASTTKAPPAIPEGKKARFVGNQWELVEAQ